MFEVIPGLGPQNEWREIERRIEIVKPFAKTIHVDIIDGKFAPNATFLDPKPFKKYSADIFFELHMMVENPIQYLKPFANAGFRRFLGHIEKMPDQAEFIAEWQLLGEVGLAVDGPTPLDAIKVPYQDLDEVLIMTIKAGQSGQNFNPEYLKKIEILRSTQNDIVIGVDGGINDQTIAAAKDAGATSFVSTSFIFNSHPPAGGPLLQFNLLQGNS